MYTKLASPLHEASTTTSTFSKRQYGYGGYGYGYGYNSPWYSWGRWVVLGGVILVALLIFFLVSCLNARRRKKRGMPPRYGTGWMAPQHGPVNYYPQTENNPNTYNQSAAPPYTAPNQTYAAPSQPYPQENSGYYGGQQQNGIELQQPGNTYYAGRDANGGAGEFQAPPGPPPGKTGRY